MKLLVVRHAIAEEVSPGEGDAGRRLTDKGRNKMRRGVKGLRKVIGRIDVLGCSPFVRAVQTAEIMCDRFCDGGVRPVIVSALEPGQPVGDVLDWLKARGADQTVALVGHEPQLGFLISWLLNGDDSRASVELRKGSACLLDFPAEIAAGCAKLLWLLKPSHLRRI
jgi:phosphohistidine phosphatase